MTDSLVFVASDGGTESLNSGGIFGLPDGPELVVELRASERRLLAAASPKEKVPRGSRSRDGDGNE